MTTLHALVLGAVQGLTEVLPVSSSAHLILIPRLLGWAESGLTFDVALHLGTLIALLVYFRRDISELAASFFSALAQRSFTSVQSLLPIFIVAATLPAAIAGKTLEHRIEETFRSNPLLISLFLILFGLLLAFADTAGAKKWKMDRMTLWGALLIGLAQCLALFPGVSRSGITITAALLLGFDRETSARFSFLLSLPVVAGAAILKGVHIARAGISPGEADLFAVGIASSAVFGYLSLVLLLRLVRTRSLYPFVWYRIVAGGGFLLWFLAGK
jgi:undecaprenyl-diphosphatase